MKLLELSISVVCMKRYGLFMGLFLTLAACYAQSAINRNLQTAPDPQAAMTSPALSSGQMQAFSQHGLEKITEWLWYMQMLRDTRSDSILFGEVVEMTMDLFLDDTVQLMYEANNLPLAEWLWANRDYDGTSVFVTRHEWIEDWQVMEEGFRRRIMLNLAVLEEEAPSWAGERVMTLYLVRINKSFGGETLQTWEIRLGSLE